MRLRLDSSSRRSESRSREPGTRIGSGRVNKMCDRVAGEIVPLRPNFAWRVRCSAHEAKRSDTAHISAQNSDPARFEFTTHPQVVAFRLDWPIQSLLPALSPPQPRLHDSGPSEQPRRGARHRNTSFGIYPPALAHIMIASVQRNKAAY